MDHIIPFLQQHGIEIIGLVLGLCYLYYEYHANAWVWLFGLLMPMISMYVYFNAGLYADFSINIYYFLAALYGLIFWTRGSNEKKEAPITHASIPMLTGCIVCAIVIWIAIYYALVKFTNSNVPVQDAFTTSVSIVASWMMARKYVEQWIGWIAVDIICVYLYIYKNIPFYAVLYAAYTIVAIFGYKNWLKLMKHQKEASSSHPLG